MFTLFTTAGVFPLLILIFSLEEEELGFDREGPAREVVIQYRDLGATDVRLAGDFNGWVPDKGVRSVIEAENGSRVWTKILHLPPGTYQYRYVVDGEWREDPVNASTAPSATGRVNSVLVVR